MKREEIIKKIRETKADRNSEKDKFELVLKSMPETEGEATLFRVGLSLRANKVKIWEDYHNPNSKEPCDLLIRRNEKEYSSIEEGLAKHLIKDESLESLVEDVLAWRIFYW